VDALWDLPKDLQLKARLVYYDGLKYAFIASTLSAVVAVIAGCLASGKQMRRTH